MGFEGYFLIVWDMIHKARSMGIPVGPGRGSAAGSLLAYSLGITDIDPIEYDLLFERFLNPERISLPDIDIDFCGRRREEVIKYVTERYGQANVSQIITFEDIELEKLFIFLKYVNKKLPKGDPGFVDISGSVELSSLRNVMTGDNSETNKRRKFEEVIGSIFLSYVNDRVDFYQKFENPIIRDLISFRG